MVKIKKKDFVEIEFTARVKEGEIFDTNIKKHAGKLGLDVKKIKPVILSVGNKMVIQGLDEELVGKETGKNYSVEFTPEKAFGKRDHQLIKMIPSRIFAEQKINPQRGMQLSLDGRLVKIISVSGGRILVDFNNPMAGKIVVYNFKIIRKVEDLNEKINALQEFFFKQEFNFSITPDKKIIIFKTPRGFDKFVELFSKNFKDILEMEIKTEIVKDGENKK